MLSLSRVVVPAVLLLAALTACASDGDRDPASATAGTPPATSATAPGTSAPAGGKVVLTEKDSGKTVALHGEPVSIRLSNGWVWQEPRVQGGAVRLDQVNYLVDPGYTEWVVNPVRAGAATVHVQGLPKEADPGKSQGPLDVTYSFNVT